jgi:cell division topological specificity factor
MSLFGWMHRRSSASVAHDRLKVLLAHERTLGTKSDLLALLRGEILSVICRHVIVEPDKVQVKMDCGAAVSTLAIEVEIPT